MLAENFTKRICIHTWQSIGNCLFADHLRNYLDPRQVPPVQTSLDRQILLNLFKQINTSSINNSFK